MWVMESKRKEGSPALTFGLLSGSAFFGEKLEPRKHITHISRLPNNQEFDALFVYLPVIRCTQDREIDINNDHFLGMRLFVMITCQLKTCSESSPFT